MPHKGPVNPRGQEDKRHGGGRRVFAQLQQQFVTVQFWHRDVAHDQIGVLSLCFLPTLFAIFRFDDVITLERQRVDNTLAQWSLVFHHQNFHHYSIPLSGIRTVKVVPSLTLLSNVIWPLCISTACLVIDNPNPVPGIVPTLSARWNASNSRV